MRAWILVLLALPAAARADAPALVIQGLPTEYEVYAGMDRQISLHAFGGQEPYAWDFGGDHPSFMTIATDSFTVTSLTLTAPPVGSWAVPICVTDATSTRVCQDIQFDLVPPGSILLDTPALSDGIAGQGYMALLRCEGGQYPYTFSASGLPDGLSLRPEPPTLAEIVGTPTVAGAFTVVIDVTDSTGMRGTSSRILRVRLPVPKVSNGQLPDATVGQPYQARIVSDPPATWSAGKLQTDVAWIELSPDGEITGTPTPAMYDSDAPHAYEVDLHYVLGPAGAETEGDYPFEMKLNAAPRSQGTGGYGGAPKVPVSATPNGGCSASGASAGAAALALMAFIRRRS